MSAIETLAMAVDAKDQITHGHIRRVQLYATELAQRLGVSDGQLIKAIEAAALLHDMGKLGIPEHILNKPGRLTDAEFERIKQHADLGADLLSSIRFPYPVVPIVRHHHENWNGSGYPAGIAKTDIPLGARILSVVDCFDALTSDRPYRPRLGIEEAFKILRERRGTMYDPLIVDTFINSHHEMAPLAIRAGQDARSVFSAELSSQTDASLTESLTRIRANASETSLLLDYREQISKASSIKEAMDLAAQYLRRITPATVYALYTYDAKTEHLVCTQAVGDFQNLLPGLSIPVGQRVTGWAAANLRTAVNSDAVLDLAQISGLFQPSLRSTISIPLIQADRVTAVLTAYSPQENGFNESHTYAFEQVALALSNKGLAVHSNSLANLVSFPVQKN